MSAMPSLFPIRCLAPASAALVLVLVLAGCDTDNLFQGEPGPHDGRWAGRLLFSAGESGCVRRGAVRVEVASSDVTGTVRGSGTDFGVRGQVQEDGSLYKGMLTRHNQPAAEVTGTFAEGEFDGRWKDLDGRCRGTIELRQVGR